MVRIRVRTLWIALAVVGMIIALGLAAIPAARAANGPTPAVTLVTPPYKAAQRVVFDFNHNGVHEPSEVVGTYDVYDWNQPIEFTWPAAALEATDLAHTSYQVSFRQYDHPYVGLNGPYREWWSAHHWASNTNGRRYVMGPFAEGVCFGCVSYIVVEAETVGQFLSTVTLTYEYEYHSLNAAPLFSRPFVLENTPRGPRPEECQPGMGGGWRRDAPGAPIYCPATLTTYTDPDEFLDKVCVANGFSAFTCNAPGPCFCHN